MQPNPNCIYKWRSVMQAPVLVGCIDEEGLLARCAAVNKAADLATWCAVLGTLPTQAQPAHW